MKNSRKRRNFIDFTMEKKIITKLRKYEEFLTYKGISLIDRSEYKLTAKNQPKLMLSPVFNFVKQCKLLMRHNLSKNKIHKKMCYFLLIRTAM